MIYMMKLYANEVRNIISKYLKMFLNLKHLVLTFFCNSHWKIRLLIKIDFHRTERKVILDQSLALVFPLQTIIFKWRLKDWMQAIVLLEWMKVWLWQVLHFFSFAYQKCILFSKTTNHLCFQAHGTPLN